MPGMTGLARTMKTYLARQIFRHYASKKSFQRIDGDTLCSLREALRGKVEFPESVCNAGLASTAEGHVCVAKNQRFSYCDELEGRSSGPGLGTRTDDGFRALYRVDFDLEWRIKSIRKLTVILNGQTVDPAIFVEDVRLMPFKGSLVAFANGNGAWPLLGELEEDVISLRSVVAAYSPPEKNWMPFEHQGHAYLEYSVNPHVILKFDPRTHACVEAYRTQPAASAIPGMVHGGAPPLRLSDDYFLGVGNSQRLYWFQDRYYAAVFYLFEAKPPFRVVRASPPVRIQGRSERIQYICGMAFGADKQHLVLSMGVCDCDNRLVLVPLSRILAVLQDCMAA